MIRHVVVGLSVLLVAGGADAGEDAAAGAALSEERFTEIGYGVSLRVPVGGEAVAVPADGAVAAWDLGDEATLRLRITSSPVAIGDLAEVVGQSWAGSWVGMTQSAPKFVNTQGLRIGERPGLIQVAELEREPPALLNPQQQRDWQGAPFFYGQAAIQLDPYALAIIEVFAPQAQAARAEAVLRAAADSVLIMNPADLYALRLGQLEAGRAWKAGFEPRRAFEAAEHEAWFVVERRGRPVGYERRSVQTDPAVVSKLKFALRDPGVAAGVQTVVRHERVELSTWRQAYVEDKGQLEMWSAVSELKTLPPKEKQVFAHEPKTVAWSETGLRDDRLITLAHQNPPDEDVVREVQRAERFRGEFVDANVLYRRTEDQWEIPDRLPAGLLDDAPPIPPTELYLGQAVLQLVPGLLPHDQAKTLAFYAYDSASNTLSLRTYEVEPTRDGGWWVVERATPGSPPVRYRFGGRGLLQEMIHPDGQRSVRSSREELSLQWPELRQNRVR